MNFIKENKIYLITCLGLAIVGIASTLIGLFYSSIYSSIVLDIAEDLNNGAPIETYTFLMQALFNGAEIEPMSRFVSISLSVMGMLFLYFASYMWLNKDNKGAFDAMFTRKYWFTFVLSDTKKFNLRQSTQQANLKSTTKNKNRSVKQKATKALTKKNSYP